MIILQTQFIAKQYGNNYANYDELGEHNGYYYLRNDENVIEYEGDYYHIDDKQIKEKEELMNILEILPIQSVTHNTKEMFAFITKKLKEMDVDYYVDNGNIYATKNPKSLPLIPAFVSHTDTVHDITDEIHVLEVDGKYIGFNRYKMGLTGIGGDDKVGIYYCFRALEEIRCRKSCILPR